jgi:hypothetical protein
MGVLQQNMTKLTEFYIYFNMLIKVIMYKSLTLQRGSIQKFRIYALPTSVFSR